MASVAEEGSIGMEPPVDQQALQQRLRHTIERADPDAMWVLEEEDRILGQVSILATKASGVLALGMALLPEARGRGAGRALLQAALDHARSCGAHKVELEVWTDNARAIALYASTGFAVEGLRRNHYRRRDDSLRSTLLMALLWQDYGPDTESSVRHG